MQAAMQSMASDRASGFVHMFYNFARRLPRQLLLLLCAFWLGCADFETSS
jgi:hypothetical protein